MFQAPSVFIFVSCHAMVKQKKVDYSHNLESLILKFVCVDFDEYDT